MSGHGDDSAGAGPGILSQSSADRGDGRPDQQHLDSVPHRGLSEWVRRVRHRSEALWRRLPVRFFVTGAGSPGPNLDRMNHSSLAEQLDRLRDRVVPVVGAGLALGCGAPSSAELADELAQAADMEVPEGPDLYEVANELERSHGTSWVQDRVAEITLARELTPTPVMLAVTLINRRLVATTNYDDAIEEAARRHGQTPTTLAPSDLPGVLQGPGHDELLVLHLHGTAHRPETIVLTHDTYEAARTDEALQLAVRVLAAGNSLVFLGHRLAANEVHLRRDVKRAVELFGGGEHLLLHAEGQLADAATFRIGDWRSGGGLSEPGWRSPHARPVCQTAGCVAPVPTQRPRASGHGTGRGCI